MQPTPEKQHKENEQIKDRKLGKKLGKDKVSREKFADMRPTSMNRPATHGPGKEIYNVGALGAPQKRVGIQRKGKTGQKTKTK